MLQKSKRLVAGERERLVNGSIISAGANLMKGIAAKQVAASTKS